jgi:hypothetical protein
MTLMGACERCLEDKPPRVPIERRRLTHGPDGEHLCARHAREAWREYDEEVVDDV